jgi:class 3 adenylate cyclase
MKSTGDGFLAVYAKMSAAFSLASAFLETHTYQDIRIRMALHWGTVKIGPDGDVLGREVHRIYRVEGVNAEDRIDLTEDNNVLPNSERILVTAQGLKQLNVSARTRFKPAGTFRLKGFAESCKLWVLHK